jgi:signal transduction histidine kinase
MRWGIRSQLLVPLLMLLLGSIGVSTWTALGSAMRAREQIDTQVRHVARVLSESGFPLTASVLRQMKGLSGAEYVLVGADGHQAATLPTDAASLPPHDAITDDWQNLRLGPRATIGGQTYLCCSLQLPPPRSDSGAALYILYPESLWRDALWQAIRPSLWFGSFVSFAAIALALTVAQRLGQRIQQLERHTRRIAAGDFSPVPLSRQDDELCDLGQSVNEMARHLSQLQEAMQKTERLRLLSQVSAGLAHQLRNGVTGARLAVQLHASACTTLADTEALDVALRQLALLESNLSRFLELGRNNGHRCEPCHVESLLDEAVTLLRPQCRHSHIDLRWQAPRTAATLSGDAGQLRHLFLNVLGNAVEAAGPGGWVEARLRLVSESAIPMAVVEIVDSGPGPPNEVVQRLFEPFVTSKRDGVGLGLAVARQAAEAHGGRLNYHRAASQTCFRVELPLQTMG